MANDVFRVDLPDEYRKAGPSDLIELQPVPGCNPLFLQKWIVETLVYGIVHHEFIHLSGPTGSAKSSLLEALYLKPENFNGICAGLGFPVRPLQLFPVEMAIFESPGELYQRRALKNGSTYDEKSRLVEALETAAAAREKVYSLIWLREMGRVHSASVQGGLLNLMSRGDIILPDGERINGLEIAWVADSNYQAEKDATHTLVTLDDALKRRFTVNLTLDYLGAEDEIQVLRHILGEESQQKLEVILKVVQMGHAIRRQRAEGGLLSVPPPTIYGYLSFLRMAQILPAMSLQQVAQATLLGNACFEDQKQLYGIFNEVFGLKGGDENSPGMGGDLF